MTDQENPEENGKRVDWRRLPLLALGVLGALFAVYLLTLWLVPAFEGFGIARERRGRIAGPLGQARADRITYGQAAAGGFAGKYVVWCVQNRGEGGVTVDGDGRKPLRVSNFRFMPVFTGSKHQACTPMLLLLEEPGGGAGVRVNFEEALEI